MLIFLWAALPFLLLLFADFHLLRKERAELLRHETIAAWPAVEGTVIESKVNTWEREIRKDGRRLSSGRRTSGSVRHETVHGADVHYRYKVGGTEFTSRVIRQVNPPVDLDRAVVAAVVARYPAGRVVRVLHDPDHPGQACLENPPPIRESPLGLILLNLVGLLLGGANLCWLAGLGMLGERAESACRALRGALPWLPHPDAAKTRRRP